MLLFNKIYIKLLKMIILVSISFAANKELPQDVDSAMLVPVFSERSLGHGTESGLNPPLK